MCKDNGSKLSTRCFLFYLGDLILFSSNPDSSFLYENGTSFYERIKEVQLKYKTNAAMIGFKAAFSWKLPGVMVKAIEYSLAPFTNFQKAKSIADEQKIDIIICYLACAIAELAVLNDFHFTHAKTLLEANDFVHKANTLISKHIY